MNAFCMCISIHLWHYHNRHYKYSSFLTAVEMKTGTLFCLIFGLTKLHYALNHVLLKTLFLVKYRKLKPAIVNTRQPFLTEKVTEAKREMKIKKLLNN